MLTKILPPTITNAYTGHKLAIWCLALIVVLKATMGLTSMFLGRMTAQGAHKVAVGALSPEAGQLVVLLLARSGLSTFVIALFCAVLLVRYRAMVPLAYVLLLIEHAGRAVLLLKESAVTGTSSATVVNLALLVLTVVGLISSLL